ncbi:MATE family efflux transporter [Shewanella sp. Isolate11]|uniref:MATE family efflux transporter n=1 Tax=Shewanella sp. Isolate11 TaxID=2908530 RepID=UPI001EFC49F0|nr:MATE family efflux transporter [Shewanella sp. Isolate11]MCG9697281.1 MATE family efflux transporter [Shewanella sp. Isolate11]
MHSAAENDQSLAIEPIGKLVWRYTIPTILSMLVTGIYVAIDGMFVGHHLGEVGLAGMMLAYPVGAILYAIGALLGMGGAALVSINLGRNDIPRARKILGNTFSLCLLAGILFAISGVLFSRDILIWLGAEGEVLTSADKYLFWYFFLGVFPVLAMAFTALLRNDGRPGFVTYVLILSGCLNALLDWLFIVVFPFGLAGAAIATMICQAVTALLCLQHFFTAKTRLRINLEQMVLSLDNCLNIVRVGFPSFLMNLYLSIVLTLHNTAFLWVGGPIHVAAFGVVSYAEALFYLVFEGIAFGTQPIFSFNAGAKRFDRVFATLKVAVWMALITAGIGLLFIYIVPQYLVYIFAGDNPQLTPVATEGMRLYFWGLPFEGLILVGAAFFQAINRPKEASILTGSKLLLIAIVIYLFAWLFGVTGVWISLASCSLVLTLWMLYTLSKLSKRLR